MSGFRRMVRGLSPSNTLSSPEEDSFYSSRVDTPTPVPDPSRTPLLKGKRKAMNQKHMSAKKK